MRNMLARGNIVMHRGIAVALVATMVGGCATAIRGTTSQVTFASEPSGAVVTTSLGQTCVAPCVLAIERNKPFEATFTKEGFERSIVAVRTEVSREGGTSFAGNLLLGGLIGMGVDAATGAALDHHPNPVVARLAAIIPPAPPPSGGARPRRQNRSGVPVALLAPRLTAAATVAQPSTVSVTTIPAPAHARP
jgi:hypothetical protein